jgi:hypothetical protein
MMSKAGEVEDEWMVDYYGATDSIKSSIVARITAGVELQET